MSFITPKLDLSLQNHQINLYDNYNNQLQTINTDCLNCIGFYFQEESAGLIVYESQVSMFSKANC